MKLLGLQKHRAEETYRLMHFVVQTEVDDGLLLLHNMTKEMVLLSKEEQRVFGHCPTDLPELIDRWFLVPIGHDDCKLSPEQNEELGFAVSCPQPIDPAVLSKAENELSVSFLRHFSRHISIEGNTLRLLI